MPTYKVTHPESGKVFRITGDQPPSERELDQIRMRHEQLAAQADSEAVGSIEFARHASEGDPKYSGNARTQGGLGLIEGFQRLGEHGNTLLAELARASVELVPWVYPGQLEAARANNVVADWFQGASDIAGKAAQETAELRKETGGPQVVGDITTAGTSVVPSLAVAPAGFAMMVATAGLQSYGATLAEAKKHYESEGLTPDEAIEVARPQALAAGLITGLVTRGFGRTGVEAAVNAVKQGGFKASVQEIFKQAGYEAADEWYDEFGQSIVEAHARGEEFDFGKALDRAGKAGALGGIVGGVVQIPGLISKEATDPGRIEEAIMAAGRKAVTDPESALNRLKAMVVEEAGSSELEDGATVKDSLPVEEAPIPVAEEYHPEPVGDPGGNTFPIPESVAEELDKVEAPVETATPEDSSSSTVGDVAVEAVADVVNTMQAYMVFHTNKKILKAKEWPNGQPLTSAERKTLQAENRRLKKDYPGDITKDSPFGATGQRPGAQTDKAGKSTSETPEPDSASTIPSELPASRSVKRRKSASRPIIGDVLDDIELVGGMKSASSARRNKNWWKANKSLYDDAGKLPPSHNFIYGGSLHPDQVLKALSESNPKYSGMEVPGLWALISAASAGRVATTAATKREAKQIREESTQRENWEAATESGVLEVVGADLNVGDKLDVEGTPLEVIAVDPDTGMVTLEDGKRFGRQRVNDTEVIYVEEMDQVETSTDFLPGDDPFSLEVHDDESFQAQADKEAAQAESRAQREKLAERQNRSLKGTSGDLGQGDLLDGPSDLFDPPSPSSRTKGLKANTKATNPQWPGPAPEAAAQTMAPIPVADDVEYSALPLGLPELVQLSKGLGGGRYPKLKKRLRDALGWFRSVAGKVDSGSIELRQDLFRLITDQEKERIQAEANTKAEQAIPGETEEDLKARAEMAGEIYEQEIQALTEERLQQEPVLGSKVLAHEIGHWVDFLPQAMIDGRGNLLGRIASLKGHLKRTMPADPNADGEQLLTQKDRNRLRRQAERENGPRPKNEDARASWKEAVKADYQSLVELEIEQRGLLSESELREQLKPLIAWHRGADQFEQYFNTSEEMYAEAFSIFLVNPSALAKRAPKYFRALIDFMERKPEVARLYEQIQNELRTGANQDTRARNLRESFDRDTEQWRERVEQAENSVANDWTDNIIYHFDRRMGPIYRVARSYKDKGKVKEAVGSFLYRGAEHELFLGEVNREVGQRLVEADLDWKDFGAYLFHQRIIASEHDVANPLGFSANSSREALLRMQENLGESSMRTLEQARVAFRSIYENRVVPLLQSSGLVSPELQKVIEERVFYATFSAVKGKPEKDIDAMLDAQFGNGVGSGIYRRVGNLGDVANPATATVNKSLSLISAAHRNHAKREVVEMLLEQEPDLIREADKRWTGKGYEYIQRGQPGEPVQTMTVMVDGKPKAYYVRNYIAEAFNQGNPIENRLFVQFLKASRGVKSLFTQWNPGFWLVNYLRDAVGIYQQLPKMSARQYARLLPRALKAARASLNHSKRNKDAERALEERILIAQSDPRGIKGDVSDEYEFKLASFGLDPAQWDKAGPKSHALAKAWNWYREQGQTLERVHKIMGLIHLEENFPDMPEWQKREMVRERAGSPDFLQRPASKAEIDAFALFYTPWKEGLRSVAKAAKQNPWAFSGKLAMTLAIPSILQALAEAGGMGDDIKEQMNSVSDYDRTNYLVLPLGWDDKEQRKAKYLRLPLWEPARVMHGLLTRALTGRGEGYLSYAGGQVPGMNPLVSAASNWATFAIFGKNPYDYFYEGNVLDQDKLTAEDPSVWTDMLKQTWNDLGGGLAYRFKEPHLKQPDPSSLEQALQTVPVVSPVVNRFLRVSNRGVLDRDKREIFKETEKHRATVRLAVKEIMRKGFAGESLTKAERKLMVMDDYAVNYWLNSMPDTALAKNSFILDRIQRAPNAEARLQLILKIIEEAGQ